MHISVTDFLHPALIPIPNGPFHPSAPGDGFPRTSFTRSNFETLDKDVKKGINYILGQIIQFWPCGDSEEVEKNRLSLVTGYSFYQENFRPHLQRFKNLELHGPDVSPYDTQAQGVSRSFSTIHSTMLTCSQSFGFIKLWGKVSIICVFQFDAIAKGVL
jgi:hypothetical protein